MQAKKSYISLFIILAVVLCGAERAVAAAPAAADSVTLRAAQTADLIIDEAYRYLGTPYRYGASGPKAFDCSGFTSFIYRKFGYTLSHSSREQANDGRAVGSDFADLQKGDIVVFGSRGSQGIVGHVGILIETSADGKDFTFIHAARGGVIVSHFQEEYYATRFQTARRILPDFDIETPEPEDNTLDFEAMYGNVFLPFEDTLADSASETPDEAEYYVVRSGDTLGKISRACHTTVDRLCELNGITRKTILHIGWRLRVR